MPRSADFDDEDRFWEPEDPNVRAQQDSLRSGNGWRIQDLADLIWINWICGGVSFPPASGGCAVGLA